jgi:hypothetical protein
MRERCDEQLQKFWDSLPGGPQAIFDTYQAGAAKIVAVKGGDGSWAAYIGTGSDYEVASHGTKLTEEQAKSFFTQAFVDCASYYRF